MEGPEPIGRRSGPGSDDHHHHPRVLKADELIERLGDKPEITVTILVEYGDGLLERPFKATAKLTSPSSFEIAVGSVGTLVGRYQTPVTLGRAREVIENINFKSTVEAATGLMNNDDFRNDVIREVGKLLPAKQLRDITQALSMIRGGPPYWIRAVAVTCDPQGPKSAIYHIPPDGDEKTRLGREIRDGNLHLTLDFSEVLPVVMDK